LVKSVKRINPQKGLKLRESIKELFQNKRIQVVPVTPSKPESKTGNDSSGITNPPFKDDTDMPWWNVVR
jgi:hypothetical protein